jgi:hypothetical protein
MGAGVSPAGRWSRYVEFIPFTFSAVYKTNVA